MDVVIPLLYYNRIYKMSGPTWARMTPEPATQDPRNGQELILQIISFYLLLFGFAVNLASLIIIRKVRLI